MTPAERDRLRALAEKALEGEQEWTRISALPDSAFDQRVYNETAWNHDRAKKLLWDACSPAVVLSLLDARDASERAVRAAFLAGVEHAAGPDGCGAVEGIAAREYAALARHRITDDAPLFGDVA